jgi:thiol-disulfide isomerase/thioredoxin
MLWRTRRLQGLASVILVLIVGGSLFYGVSQNQHEQAQAIGAVLCTSCVGIEDARTERPRWTEAQIAEIEAINVPIELIVFYAPWCHACPFAEELVEWVAERNERISYRFVNVEEDSALAKSYGVIRSGRTVVPATVRSDNGSVLFGVENLEQRLVEMLRAEP